MLWLGQYSIISQHCIVVVEALDESLGVGTSLAAECLEFMRWIKMILVIQILDHLVSIETIFVPTKVFGLFLIFDRHHSPMA